MVPPRTTANLVQGILGDDYGPNTAGVLPDLTPYIATASALVDDIANLAGNRIFALTLITLTASKLELIERWLAAHFYQQSDQGYASRSTQGAAGQFQGKTNDGIEGTKYGQMAIRLDTTNTLRNLDKNQRATALWLGKPVSAQISYSQRS